MRVSSDAIQVQPVREIFYATINHNKGDFQEQTPVLR